ASPGAPTDSRALAARARGEALLIVVFINGRWGHVSRREFVGIALHVAYLWLTVELEASIASFNFLKLGLVPHLHPLPAHQTVQSSHQPWFKPSGRLRPP
ncbi:MAG: hypothetical protein ACXWG8_13285, partial [Usitatibacter sp.]